MYARQLKIWPDGAASGGKGRGEAFMGSAARVEASVTPVELENPADDSRLMMERIASHENLTRARRRVVSNGGAPGPDGMTVRALMGWLDDNIEGLRKSLLSGGYKPGPVRRKEIPKASGGTRQLGIPNVIDRLVQQSVAQVLQEMYDPTFSDSSYGFRPGRSAHQAMEKAKGYINGGNRWIVDLDIEKFFDRVNHDRLMSTLTRKITDGRALGLIRGFLTAGVMREGLVSPVSEGTPQGGPLSPLLSNIVLDELDRELERRKHKFVRYADDCNIFVKSRRSGARVMEAISKFIGARLCLKVSGEKSSVVSSARAEYLGFAFWKQKGETVLRVAKRSFERLKRKVKFITKRKRTKALSGIISELSVYLRGWYGYFRICHTVKSFAETDMWIRRRLRCLMWTQWKRGKNRYAELRRLGLSQQMAALGASSQKGPWRMSRNQAISAAIPVSFFDSAGLFRLAV